MPTPFSTNTAPWQAGDPGRFCRAAKSGRQKRAAGSERQRREARLTITGEFGIGRAGPAYAPRGVVRVPPPSAFRLPGEAAPGIQAATPVTLPSLLAMQEAGQDAVRDREAREHGEALLHGLAALQRALLGGGDPGTLTRLAALVRRAPAPADPRLLAVQRALLVRVAVELARTRAAASA